MTIHNPNCDGDRCDFPHGEVRLYPLGAGANLILCAACWVYENGYREQRARETGAASGPLLNWTTAKVYATL